MPYDHFDSRFLALTGHPPFPWQRTLYEAFNRGRFPSCCTLPTGLGKTSVMAIWLLALVERSGQQSLGTFPRRLVWVVNRRTVVDQATSEAELLRSSLEADASLQPLREVLAKWVTVPGTPLLGISTLRGQFEDNAEWRDDPARPAICVGTVDMVGSRLLFSGYGRGFKSRPLHAAFLGHDVLVVHDEAHLEPAFQDLLDAVVRERAASEEWGCFHVIALTATPRSERSAFGLGSDDLQHPVVARRVGPRKGLSVHLTDEKRVAESILDHALGFRESGQAILVFARTVDDVTFVASALKKQALRAQALTGTLRGHERDALAARDEVFARFIRHPRAAPATGTVYLVCTAAGEVGIDMSADHLVCDLVPYDSLAQRLGRVNRYGDGDATVDVVAPSTEGSAEKQEEPAAAGSADAYAAAVGATRGLLGRLPLRPDGRRDASPTGLAAIDLDERIAASTPTPIVVRLTDILLDAWTMTSLRGELPGRPPVADWLHGVAYWQPPDTFVAWRDEVDNVTGGLLDDYPPEALLKDWPVAPRETLRDRTYRVEAQLASLASRCPDAPAWIVDTTGSVHVTALGDFAKEAQRAARPSIAGRTVLLPPSAGGLSGGMLDGNADPLQGPYDVSGAASAGSDGGLRRIRVWDDQVVPPGFRLVRTLDLRRSDEGDDPGDDDRPRFWKWYTRPRVADDDGSGTALSPQSLDVHLRAAEQCATAITERLTLDDARSTAVRLAARWHDLGKDRAIWQRSIGNHDYPATTLAKSGNTRLPREITRYRHEFGSLLDLRDFPEFASQAGDVQDLVLHLIAAHHGRARPHFDPDEAFDPSHSDATSAGAAADAIARFAHLQQRHGRWGLAYLESLVRAADALASQQQATTPHLGGGTEKEASA